LHDGHLIDQKKYIPIRKEDMNPLVEYRNILFGELLPHTIETSSRKAMRIKVIADLNFHACPVLTKKDLFGFVRRDFIIYSMHITYII
jgi:hypothetical protein